MVDIYQSNTGINIHTGERLDIWTRLSQGFLGTGQFLLSITPLAPDVTLWGGAGEGAGASQATEAGLSGGAVGEGSPSIPPKVIMGVDDSHPIAGNAPTPTPSKLPSVGDSSAPLPVNPVPGDTVFPSPGSDGIATLYDSPYWFHEHYPDTPYPYYEYDQFFLQSLPPWYRPDWPDVRARN